MSAALRRCPTCRQPIATGPRRICALCGDPIGKRHRWQFGPDGRAQHRDCANPTSIDVIERRESAQLEMVS